MGAPPYVAVNVWVGIEGVVPSVTVSVAVVGLIVSTSGSALASLASTPVPVFPPRDGGDVLDPPSDSRTTTVASEVPTLPLSVPVTSSGVNTPSLEAPHPAVIRPIPTTHAARALQRTLF